MNGAVFELPAVMIQNPDVSCLKIFRMRATLAINEAYEKGSSGGGASAPNHTSFNLLG